MSKYSVISQVAGGCLVLLLAAGCATSPGRTSRIGRIDAPFAMPRLQRPVFPERTFNITGFGAVSGGVTLNPDAVQRAIDACAQAGGGKVVVPAGKWLIAPIELKSRVNLHLEAGAELIFTDDKSFYFSPAIQARLRGIVQHSGDLTGELPIPRPLISAYECEDIAITGPGKLDGQGIYWWPLHKDWLARQKGFPAEAAARAWRGLDTNGLPGRAMMFQPFKCRNVLLEDFTAVDSPFWFINPVACEDFIARGLTIRAAAPSVIGHAPNTDGIDPDSCRNVLIENCDIATGDDAVAIKSGLDEAGRKRALPCENIVIRNLRCKRIAIGSEMSGGVRNVFIHNCDIWGTMSSIIHIKTRRGRGSVVENVWVQDIKAGPVLEAILKLDMEYWLHVWPKEPERKADMKYWIQFPPVEPESVSESTPRFRNFHFKNITSSTPSPKGMAIFANGLPEMPLENFTFENLQLAALEGIICRNVRGLTFNNVTVTPQRAPVLMLENCQNVIFDGLAFPPDRKPFLTLKGPLSKNVWLPPKLAGLEEEVQLEQGATPDAVRFEVPK